MAKTPEAYRAQKLAYYHALPQDRKEERVMRLRFARYRERSDQSLNAIVLRGQVAAEVLAERVKEAKTIARKKAKRKQA